MLAPNRTDDPRPLLGVAVAICHDCVHAVANAEYPHDADEAREDEMDTGLARIVSEVNGESINTDGAPLGFSHEPCDACRQPRAAGDRYRATVLTRDPEHGDPIPAPFDDDDADAFTDGYIDAMLWANTLGIDAGGELVSVGELDDKPTRDDIDASAVESMTADCLAFIDANRADLAAYRDERSATDAGHDYALTRNRHGAGFWDRGLGALGERLADAARADGESSLFVAEPGDGPPVGPACIAGRVYAQ